jgi:two-component system chemotaxis response regulator CheB
MPTRDIIVIGGSAGSIVSLRKVLRDLPADFPAALFVVIHIAPTSPGVLAQVLAMAGRLPAETAVDGTPIRSGRIYVAPPDHHLLLGHGHVRGTRGPRENGCRPAVDPLFRTAATLYGSRVIGVILSGLLDDGTFGLSDIKRRGGLAIVQDPRDAEATGMPQSAISRVAVDQILPADQIAAALIELAGALQDVRAMENHLTSTPLSENGHDPAERGTDALHTGLLPGPPSAFRCPECGGALWELHDGALIRFQCHVGHGYNGDSLAAAHAEALESALWTALRTLTDDAALRRRMAAHARDRGMSRSAQSYEKHAQDSERRADVIRAVLVTDATESETRERSDG